MIPIARLMDTSTNRQCFTISQAKQRSELSGTYLGQLLRGHVIDGFQIGREWFVYVDSLERFLGLPRKSGPKGPRNGVA